MLTIKDREFIETAILLARGALQTVASDSNQVSEIIRRLERATDKVRALDVE